MKLFNIIKKKNKEQPTDEFYEWKRHLDRIISCDYEEISFDILREKFPSHYSAEYNMVLADSMEKLENLVLKRMVSDFERKWNRGIQSGDSTLIKRAWFDLKKSLDQCLFFKSIDSFPEDISYQIVDQVTKVAVDIQKTCEKSVRLADNENGSLFMKDVYYLIVRNRIAD